MLASPRLAATSWSIDKEAWAMGHERYRSQEVLDPPHDPTRRHRRPNDDGHLHDPGRRQPNNAQYTCNDESPLHLTSRERATIKNCNDPQRPTYHHPRADTNENTSQRRGASKAAEPTHHENPPFLLRSPSSRCPGCHIMTSWKKLLHSPLLTATHRTALLFTIRSMTPTASSYSRVAAIGISWPLARIHAANSPP